MLRFWILRSPFRTSSFSLSSSAVNGRHRPLISDTIFSATGANRTVLCCTQTVLHAVINETFRVCGGSSTTVPESSWLALCRTSLRILDSRVDCRTVTKMQCIDPKWKPILVEDCPNICGFCLLKGDCVDRTDHCANDPSICQRLEMRQFVRENCRRTCNLCSESAKNTICPPDTSSSCSTWARKGFCTNNFYTDEQRRRYCARTCNLC